MKQYNFIFQGSMMSYFIYNLLWLVAFMISFGFALPFFIVWQFRWFTQNLTIVESKKDGDK